MNPAEPSGSAANKSLMLEGLDQSRYVRRDTVRRTADPAPGEARPIPEALGVLIAEPTRVLSARLGVPLSIDVVEGVPPTGSPTPNEFTPVTSDVLMVELSGGNATTGDRLVVELVRAHDDDKGGASNEYQLVYELADEELGTDIPLDAGDWTHALSWDGDCGLAGLNCVSCDGALSPDCPVATRFEHDALGNFIGQQMVTLPPVLERIRPGEYVLRARVERGGFSVGEAVEQVFVPSVLRLIARYHASTDDTTGDGDRNTVGNLHTYLYWMGLANSAGTVPTSPEDYAIRADFLGRILGHAQSVRGLVGIRLRWQLVDDPTEPFLEGAINALIGGDPLDGAASCGVSEGLPRRAPGECTNSWHYYQNRTVYVTPGPTRDASGAIVNPFPACEGTCAGVPHGLSTSLGCRRPTATGVWGDVSIYDHDAFYTASRNFHPDYPELPPGTGNGTRAQAGEWPIAGSPTDRQLGLDAYITLAARHVATTLAHEFGHALGVPDNRNDPNCSFNAGILYHNQTTPPGAGAGGGVTTASSDTQLDVMDNGVARKYTPETGISEYHWPGMLTLRPHDISGFTDDQRPEADSSRAPAPPSSGHAAVQANSAQNLKLNNR